MSARLRIPLYASLTCGCGVLMAIDTEAPTACPGCGARWWLHAEARGDGAGGGAATVDAVGPEPAEIAGAGGLIAIGHASPSRT